MNSNTSFDALLSEMKSHQGVMKAIIDRWERNETENKVANLVSVAFATVYESQVSANIKFIEQLSQING